MQPKTILAAFWGAALASTVWLGAAHHPGFFALTVILIAGPLGYLVDKATGN